jgi:hypothetical protein
VASAPGGPFGNYQQQRIQANAQVNINLHLHLGQNQATNNLGAYGVYGAAAAAMGAVQYGPSLGVSAAAFANVSASANLGVGWGAFAGGLYGQAQQAQNVGAWAGLGVQGFAMPGNFALGMASMAGAGGVSAMDNAVEVAGTGMGADKKYKMMPGELLAVYSLLKENKNLKPDKMQTLLKERYGIEAEVKDIDGKKALVNTTTGNVMIRDGNGNNQMDMKDMKFEAAVKKVEERFGIDVEGFQAQFDLGKQGAAKSAQGVRHLQGVGGLLGGPQGYRPQAFGNQAFGNQGHVHHGHGHGHPQQGPGQQGYGPLAYGSQSGLWSDPRWLNTIMTLFRMAQHYAQPQGARGF